MTVKLRPHHLLCIQNFTGSGYDAAFTAHLTALVQSLRAHPETIVTLTNGADDLCAVCPHLHDGVCASAQKVAALDGNVCRVCGVMPGQTAAWSVFAEQAAEKILRTPEFHQICACCDWYPLCRQTEASKHETFRFHP